MFLCGLHNWYFTLVFEKVCYRSLTLRIDLTVFSSGSVYPTESRFYSLSEALNHTHSCWWTSDGYQETEPSCRECNAWLPHRDAISVTVYNDAFVSVAQPRCRSGFHFPNAIISITMFLLLRLDTVPLCYNAVWNPLQIHRHWTSKRIIFHDTLSHHIPSVLGLADIQRHGRSCVNNWQLFQV